MPATPVNPLVRINGTVKAMSVSSRMSRHAIAAKVKPENRRVDSIAAEMLNDYQIELCLDAIWTAVSATPITFSVEDGDNRADALAEQLSQLWEDTLPKCKDALSRGRVAFEKVFGFDAEHSLSIVKSLDQLPINMTEMVLDKDADGEFAGIKLNHDVTIPAEKSWWLAINPTPLEPYGRGILMGAPYRSWKTRQEAVRLRDVFVRRFILGWIMVRCRPQVEDDDGQKSDNFKAVLDAVDDMRAGGAMAMSSERGEDGEYLDTVENVGEVKDLAPLDNTINRMDAEQVRAFGFSEKVVTEGNGVGSYAMVKEQAGLLYSLSLSILSQIAKSFQKYIVDKIVAVNCNGKTKITVVYPKITEQQQAWLIDVVKGMLLNPQLSTLILSGAVDVRQILESIGVPLTSEAEVMLASFLKSQTPVDTTAIASPLMVDSVAAPVASDAPAVADTALNGAQISSLVDIVSQAAVGSLPVETVKQIINASFPTLTDAAIDAILAPLLNFKPAVDSTGKPIETVPDATAMPLASGQYADVTRSQWKRNLKAIDDIRKGFADGSMSDVMAVAMLGSIGWVEADARKLLDDIRDNGTVDDPALQEQVEPPASQQLAKLPAVPKNVWTVDRVEAMALKEFAKLKAQLTKALKADADDEKIATILDDIQRLQIAVRFASRLVGMSSPWKPSLVDGDFKALPKTLAAKRKLLAIPGVSNNEGDYWRFPFIDAAAKYLKAKSLVTDEQLQDMAKEDRVYVLSAPGVDSKSVLSHIRESLTASIKEGETRDEFAARIESAVALPTSQLETLFRTNTHQAYIAGMQATMANESIAEEFPYDMLSSTADTRVRDTHEDVDGFVVKRGTKEHAVLLALLADYNCRCTMIPLTEDDAKSYGIKTYSDLPADVVATYG